jgi:hypothetical protein
VHYRPESDYSPSFSNLLRIIANALIFLFENGADKLAVETINLNFHWISSTPVILLGAKQKINLH